MKSKHILPAVIVILCLYSASLFAAVVVPDIKGFSTVSEIFEGEYDGWFYYKIDVSWNLSQGISHLDLILMPCIDDGYLFESAGGISDGGSIPWLGYFEREGDKSANPAITEPVIKFEPVVDPGISGSGTFWFYSNAVPYFDYYAPDAIVTKAGSNDIYGPLEGAYPSCEVSPEPATVVLLGVGSVLLVVKKYEKHAHTLANSAG